MAKLMTILKSVQQVIPMPNSNFFVPTFVVVLMLIGIPVNSDIFSPKQWYYEVLYEGRKEAVATAYSLIEEGRRQLREKMFSEAEDCFKKALRICQTQGLAECEQDALDGWREVLKAIGQHKRVRLINELQLIYASTKKHW